MHPMFPVLLEMEIARRQAELRDDRVTSPRRVRPTAPRRLRRARPGLRLVRG